MKELLPRYMMPNRTIQMERMPLTTNGKIDRVGLSKLADEKRRN